VRALRTLLAVVAVGALSFTFTACGDDDGGALATGSDDSADRSDDIADDLGDLGDDSSDDSADLDDIDDFCLNEEFMAAAASAGLDEDSDDPEDLARFFDQMADEVPDEISDDFATYAEFFGEYLSVIAEFDGDYSKMASDPDAMAALERLSDPKFEEAGRNIEEWMSANC
jgi:hypothetical protein